MCSSECRTYNKKNLIFQPSVRQAAGTCMKWLIWRLAMRRRWWKTSCSIWLRSTRATQSNSSSINTTSRTDSHNNHNSTCRSHNIIRYKGKDFLICCATRLNRIDKKKINIWRKSDFQSVYTVSLDTKIYIILTLDKLVSDSDNSLIIDALRSTKSRPITPESGSSQPANSRSTASSSENFILN